MNQTKQPLPSPNPTPKVIERETRKILLQLAKKSRSIIKKNNQYILHNPRSEKLTAPIPLPIIQTLLTKGLLTHQHPNQLTINKTGLRWLRRAQLQTANHAKQDTTNKKQNPNPHNIFQQQHQEIECPNHNNSTPAFNHKENTLFWLHKRHDRKGNPIISKSEMLAGCKLAEDFYHSTQKIKTTVDLSRPRGDNTCRYSETIPLNEYALAARKRLQKALTMLGPDLANIALKICCHHQTLKNTEQQLSLPPRSAKIILRIALARLAPFYGIPNDTKQ